MSDTDADVREALYEFQQYLSDQVAPLLVRDSIALLLRSPPALAAAAIQAWVGAQPQGTLVSDYLFHAVSRVRQLGDVGVFPTAELVAYLEPLGQELLASCPPEEQERLQASLARLAESQSTSAIAAVELLHRQPGSADAGVSSASGSAAESAASSSLDGQRLRRVNVLLERLTHLAGSASTAEPSDEAPRRELMSQVATALAKSSTSGRELDLQLDRLRQVDAAADTDALFRALGDSLPGWALASPRVEVSQAPAESDAAQAMQRIVELAQDPAEASKRFRGMVLAAIAQFNEGLLTRAAAMFDLAERIVEEKSVSTLAIDSIRQSVNERLSPDRLRKFAESSDKHPLLRKVLRFFPRLSPHGLLDDLSVESERDQCHALLALLAAHGEAARSACLERLEAAVPGEDQPGPTYLGDLIHLLRTIPRPPDAPAHVEVDLVSRISGPRAAFPLVKEAIGYLGAVEADKSEAVLIGYLKAFERMLLSGETEPYDAEHFTVLLDRTVAALARKGTRNATRVAVDHGLKSQKELGDTRARLAGLGAHDLSAYSETVTRLVAALRAALPGKLLGRFVKTNEGALVSLVKALSRTPVEEVKTLLTEVKERFPAKEHGQAAAKALAQFDVEVAPRPPSLLGDLELFGLPSLLQNLAGIPATGVLNLLDSEERVASVLTFEEGKLRHCEAGHLRGREAVYQLFEKPFPGTFSFAIRNDAASPEDSDEPLDVVHLIMEGIRRHDEFRQACTLVPDDAVLKATRTEAASPEDEAEEALFYTLWERAASGMTAAQCEAQLPVDSYRIRRLLARWVEEGALEHD